MDRETVAECAKCHQRWPVFTASQPKVPNPDYEVDITETSRTEEPIGDEQRTIDNSKSSIELTRRFTVSREWSQSYSIEYEKMCSNKQQLNLGVAQGVDVGIRTAAEDSIRERYAVSGETRQTYAEEITLNVPARTKLCVVLHWKRIWQQGFLVLKSGSGQIAQLPFQIAVGITFDQVQADEPP